MLLDAEWYARGYACGISSPSFFNKWLEKNGIMRNQFQEIKLHWQPEEFYS